MCVGCVSVCLFITFLYSSCFNVLSTILGKYSECTYIKNGKYSECTHIKNGKYIEGTNIKNGKYSECKRHGDNFNSTSQLFHNVQNGLYLFQQWWRN